MLPVPNLDDRLFEQLVKDARKAIPKYIPEWTDENYHDPGITLIELLSWFTEMQQYYLNQITKKNELKFLKLLGIRPYQPISAQARVTFSGSCQDVIIPQGTKLAAREQVFETVERLVCTSAILERVLVRTEKETNDYTTFNENNGVSFYAFGQEAKQGSCLYLGFNQALPVQRSLSLMIKLFDDYPVPKGEGETNQEHFIPSAKLSWKYFGGDQGAPSWLDVDVLHDETLHLSHGGQISFSLPQAMKPTMIHPANEIARYWLICQLEEEGYEVPPRVEEISINTISAVQRETLSEVHTFTSTGQSEQRFTVDTYLSLFGFLEVQVQGNDGLWQDWREVAQLTDCQPEDAVYQLVRDEGEKMVSIHFGNGATGSIPPLGKNNIRVICYSPTFAKQRILGKSMGLPNQRFELFSSAIVADSLRVQVATRRVNQGDKEKEKLVWQDWQRVEDFDNSKPDAPHYVLNLATKELIFGNHEFGQIPEKIDRENIRLIACQVGGGERGNVQKQLISQIIEPSIDLTQVIVSNHFPASGGLEGETVEAAKLRAQRTMKKPERAITAHDFEELVRSTPGLRVARVKAIPLFEVGLRDYPRNKAPAQVTVVVVPYSEAKKPWPSSGFLTTIKKRLEQQRLITTEIHVVPPEYVKITVHAVVVVEDFFKDDATEVIAVLNQLLQPLDHAESKGWPFGRTVYKGDVFGVINQMKGVSFIQDLWLEAEGRGIKKELNGNITLPPHGLVYSGEHQIEVVSKRDL